MLSIINVRTKEILSRGLTDFEVDFLMYRKNHIKNKDLKVIEDLPENEIEIKDKKIYYKNEVKILGLNY